MKHSETPILEIHVEVNPKGIVHFDSELGSVGMVPFRGTADGPLFNGIVEPCGVDTQITNQCGVKHMSARYMLTGKDADGTLCHIYVENNGWFQNDTVPHPFHTVPTFITDSPRLAPYLHRNQFIGEGTPDGSNLRIRFFEVCRP